MSNTGSNALVKDWIDQYAPQQHAVFRPNEPVHQRAQYLASQQQVAGTLTDDFCKIIEQYQKAVPLHPLGNKWNLRGAHSWEDVVRAAKDAEEAYLAETKMGARGAVHRYLRRFGDYSATATPWVGLLPNDKYFSVLCGGLKIVLGMAARRSERRIEIFEAFEMLPAVIEKTQRCHEIFPHSLELQDRALKVYLDILTMIEAMMACLVEKKMLTRIKDGLKGPLADHNLDEKKRRFQMSTEALQEQMNFLHLSASAKAHTTIESMGPSVHNTQRVMTSIDQGTRALNSSAVQIATGIDGLRSNVVSHERTTQSLKRAFEIERRENEENRKAIRYLSSVLEDHVRNAEWNQAILLSKLDAMDRSVELRDLQLRLQNYLGHSSGVTRQEIDLVHRQAQSCDVPSQGAMHWVLQSLRFKRWVRSPSSDVLAVNGNLEDGMARYSSASLLCAMLVHSLQGQQAAHVLQFFCGAHNSKFDPSAGPIGLVRSLTAQLLSIQRFDIGFLRFENWENGLRFDDLNTYCSLLRRLVRKLPGSVVFCMVDGVSLFEMQGWADDLRVVAKTLIETVFEEQLTARIKLLFTSASKSRCLDSLLSEDNKLTVPTDGGNRRLLTSRLSDFELVDGRRSPMQASNGGILHENLYDAGYE